MRGYRKPNSGSCACQAAELNAQPPRHFYTALMRLPPKYGLPPRRGSAVTMAQRHINLLPKKHRRVQFLSLRGLRTELPVNLYDILSVAGQSINTGAYGWAGFTVPSSDGSQGQRHLHSHTTAPLLPFLLCFPLGPHGHKAQGGCNACHPLGSEHSS